MDGSEKREYKRLGAKFNLVCSKVGSTAEQFHTGCTVNVSPGGLYFETTDRTIERGNLLKVELSIPPSSGLLQFGGKIAGFAKVLRIDNICKSPAGTDSSFDRCGIAVQFCRPLKLSV